MKYLLHIDKKLLLCIDKIKNKKFIINQNSKLCQK
jgi:hypothetical protein